MANLLQVIKKAAIEAVEASKPMCYVYGTVKKINPIAISIDQKLTLTSEFLTLSNNVKDYTVEVTADFESLQEKGTITIHNGLKVGEKVIMLRQAGGQHYLVLDRMGE